MANQSRADRMEQGLDLIGGLGDIGESLLQGVSTIQANKNRRKQLGILEKAEDRQQRQALLDEVLKKQEIAAGKRERSWQQQFADAMALGSQANVNRSL